VRTGENSVVVKHVGKGVTMNSDKQMYRWVHNAHGKNIIMRT
jgi:hypothetical protein